MGSNPASQKQEMEENEAYSFAMTLTCSSVLPMVLTTVIELDVLEIIKRVGPGAHLSPAQIVAQLPAKNPNAATTLDRMLRLLASYSILSCSVQTHEPNGRAQRCYGLMPVCKFLTKDEDGATLGAFSSIVQDKVFIDIWYHLKDAVLEDTVPFNKCYGMGVFKYLATDSRFNTILKRGFANQSIIATKKILNNYEGFEGLSSLVDIGGNDGATLGMIISRYPTIRGTNFDLPYVIAHAPTYAGVEHVQGDMFESVPTADAMFMKWVLHDWNDELCTKLLKNCYTALPNNGKVIVCEYILPITPETNHAAKAAFQMDVLMLADSPSGKERTQLEFEALAKRAGFQGFLVACSVYDDLMVMEFLKMN